MNDFDSMPILKTARLTLRKMKLKDCFDMYDYSKMPEVTKFLLWSEHPSVNYTKKHLQYVIKKYRRSVYYDWAIIYEGGLPSETFDKYKGHMIGTCGFSALDMPNKCGEIGYVLHPAFKGNGIATEAAHEVMCFGFESLGLERIEAKYMIGNDPSRRVMEKLGMCYEGTLRSSMLVKGIFRDIGICAILKGEYLRRKYTIG